MIKWWPILASGNGSWNDGRKCSSTWFPQATWMLTSSTSKKPSHLCCKEPSKGSLWSSLLGILASCLLSLQEAAQGGQPKGQLVFKRKITSQRKYWALGRSTTSPEHVRFAFQPKRRSWQGDNRKRPGKESSIQCSVCKVALCMPDCFQLYNTVQDCVAAYIRRHTWYY